MMYIKTSKRPGEKRNRTITMIGSGIVIVIVLIQLFVPHFLSALFTTIARPFWRIEFSVSSGSLDSPAALLAQNQALKIKLQTVMLEDVGADFVRAQNQEIMSLFGRSSSVNISNTSSTNSNLLLSSTSNIFSTSTTSTSSPASSLILTTGSPVDHFNLSNLVNPNNQVLAAILVKPPLAPYDELIIDAGADQGIAVGAKVYAPGNILIGTTTDVLSETSKVTLLSSPGEKYPVIIGANHVSADAIGRGGGQYEAEVPQATQIAIGDLVSDANIADGTFGKVISILNNPADPFETILFSAPVNIYQLRFVLVDSSNSLNISDVTKPIVKPVPVIKATKTKK